MLEFTNFLPPPSSLSFHVSNGPVCETPSLLFIYCLQLYHTNKGVNTADDPAVASISFLEASVSFLEATAVATTSGGLNSACLAGLPARGPHRQRSYCMPGKRARCMLHASITAGIAGGGGGSSSSSQRTASAYPALLRCCGRAAGGARGRRPSASSSGTEQYAAPYGLYFCYVYDSTSCMVPGVCIAGCSSTPFLSSPSGIISTAS
jgi:hypothetical protein